MSACYSPKERKNALCTFFIISREQCIMVSCHLTVLDSASISEQILIVACNTASVKLDDFLSPFCRTPNNKKLVSYGLFMQKPVESF